MEAATELERGGPNAVGRMLGLLGDEWTLLIVQQALLGSSRYGDFKAALPISHSVLTARLTALTGEGLLSRHVYQENPPRAEYLVTRRSSSLWPCLVAIWDWERHWVPAHAETLPRMVHQACDSEFAPVLSCGSCAQAVTVDEISMGWGPSGSWERSVPQVTTRRRWDSQGGQAGLFPDTMTIMGNRWASALMGAAFAGITRFTDFAKALGAPPNLLADRLRAFVAIGVLAAPPGEYRLTEKGLAFFPVIAMAMKWAHRWFHAPEGPALVQVHRGCGTPFEAELRCDQCTEAVHGRDIRVAPAASLTRT